MAVTRLFMKLMLLTSLRDGEATVSPKPRPQQDLGTTLPRCTSLFWWGGRALLQLRGRGQPVARGSCTRSLLHPSCHRQRDHFSGSGSAQCPGATVHRRTRREDIVQDHEPFALENLVVAHGESIPEVLHTRFGIEFRLGGRVLHASQVSFQHGYIDHLAQSRRQILRLIELPLSQLAWMQR